jgi:hypothetical protein
MASQPVYNYSDFGQNEDALLGQDPHNGGVNVAPQGPAGGQGPNSNMSGDMVANAAGYFWDPVQNKYVKGMNQQIAAGQALNQGSYINTLMGQIAGGPAGSLMGLNTAAGIGREPGVSISSGQPGVGDVAPADPSAANAATFAKAKDAAGQSARGSLTGLRESLAERGMLGSGAGASAERVALERANQPVNDVIRQQAVQDEQTNNTFALANLQSKLSQRAQNLQEADAVRAAQLGQRSQDITQRGQDISRQESQAAINAQILKGLTSSFNINASMEY